MVRADAGGTWHWLVETCRDRNIGFSLGFQITAAVRDAVVCDDDARTHGDTDLAVASAAEYLS